MLTRNTRVAAIVLALGGLVLGVGGEMHPHPEPGQDYDASMADMMDQSVWPISHTMTLVGAMLIGWALASLLTSVGTSWRPQVRRVGWLLFSGAVLMVVEYVPHTLAFIEASEARDGGSTPLLDFVGAIELVSNPVFGFGLAALALVTATSRELANGRIMAVPAVVGGVLFGFAGPLLTLTRVPETAVLFTGGAGMALWLAVAGARMALGGDGQSVMRPERMIAG